MNIYNIRYFIDPERSIDIMRRKSVITMALANTKLPSIHITATQEAATCLDSKFGGICYLPKGEKIPICPEGEEMRFLAQINFAQIPRFKGFPQKGILQFFVDTDQKRMHKQVKSCIAKPEYYAVRYYPKPDATLQQEIQEQQFTISQTTTEVILGKKHLSWQEYLDWKTEQDKNKEAPVSIIRCRMEGKSIPETKEKKEVCTPQFIYHITDGHIDLPYPKGKMAFHKKNEVATLIEPDFGYECAVQKMGGIVTKLAGYDIENWCSDTDALCWDFGNWGHKIGGHPAIKWRDPRIVHEAYHKYTTLLFQYDFTTKEELEQHTLAFFISPEDLLAGHFEDTILYWHDSF